MKFKKFVAALSAVTMLGSLAAAVPASAKTVSVENFAITASKVFSVRGTNATMTVKNKVTEIASADTELEMTYADAKNKASFGAVYYFDIPEGATVNSAAISVYTNGSHKGVQFTVVPMTIPSNVTLTTDNVFDYVAGAKITTAENTVSITNNADDTPMTGDISSLYSADSTPNAFFLYKPNQNDTNPRKIMGTATLTVSYTYDDGTVDNAVAQIGSKQYATFAEAFVAAQSDDTIELLEDVTTSDRYVMDSGTTSGTTYKRNISNITIDGKGHSMTGTNNFLFETNGKTLTLKNITISGGTAETINAKVASTINLIDATVSANAIATNNESSVINAENLNITNPSDGLNIVTSTSTKGKINITLTEALAAQYDVINGVLEAKHSEAFTFTKTADEFGAGAQIKIVFQNDETETTKEYSDELGTSFSGDGTAAIAVVITGIKEGYSVKSVTIE